MALDIDQDAPAPIPQPIGIVKTIKENIGEHCADQGVFADLGLILTRGLTTEEYYGFIGLARQIFPDLFVDAGLLAVFELAPQAGRQINMVASTKLFYAEPPKAVPAWTPPEPEEEE